MKRCSLVVSMTLLVAAGLIGADEKKASEIPPKTRKSETVKLFSGNDLLHSNKVPQEVQLKDLVVTTFPEEKLITVKVE